MPPKRKPITVVAAVERDLIGLAKRDQELAESGLAASALALARELDKPDNSATSKSMCAKSLQDIMTQLRLLAPARPARDGLDEISARRERRRATA